jgi:WD40 repeat protein
MAATLVAASLVAASVPAAATEPPGTPGSAPAAPSPAAREVVVIDGPTSAIGADRALGDAIQVVPGGGTFTLFVSAAGRSGELRIPADLTVGEHGDELLARGLSTYVADSRSCQLHDVRATVHEVAVAGGTLERLALDLQAGCGDGLRTAAAVRWRSEVPLHAVVPVGATSPNVDAAVGGSVERTITLRGLGDAGPLASATVVAALSPLTGEPEPGASDWSVVHDGCAGVALPAGVTCEIRLTLRPTAPGYRAARLAWPDEPFGVRSLRLSGRGHAPPAAPALHTVAESLGRVALTFAPPVVTDGAGDVVADAGAVVVRRRPATGGAWADVARVEGPFTSHTTHVDRTVMPGVAYEYALQSDGRFGRGPQGPTIAVANLRADVLGVREHGLVGARAVDRPQVWFAAPGGDRTSTPAASPDGRTLVEARGDVGSRRLWRAPSLGTAAAAALTSLPGDALDPAVSPDGRTVAFTQIQGGTRSVWTVPLAGGTPTKLRDHVANPTWDRDGRSVVAEDHREGRTAGLVRVGLDGSLRTVLSGGREPTVSPDGRFLAYRTASTTPVLVVRHLDHGTEAFLGEPKLGFTAPAWSPDGRQVVAVVRDARSWPVTTGLTSVTVGVSGGSPVLTRRQSEVVSRWTDAPAARALGVHLTSAPQRTGPSPSVGFGVWQAPTGTTSTCSLDGAAAQPCSSPWRGSGVTTGRHRLVVETREPSGVRSVTSHVWDVDADPPTVTVTAPAATTLGDRATVTWRASDPSGVANADVRYRVARFDGSFGEWVLPDTWQRTTATSRSLTLTRGRQVCFSVRARDAYGNRSAWSAPRCTSRPLDDRALGASSGWTRGTGSAFYDGTITSTTRRGAELARTEVRANRVVVVATRCPTCGTADVFIGATRVGRLDLSATTTQRQQVISLPRAPTVLTGKLTIRVTSTDRPVAIDGVAFRRD